MSRPQKLAIAVTLSLVVAPIDRPFSGFVTLRPVAIDAAGNKIHPPIERAYELK